MVQNRVYTIKKNKFTLEGGQVIFNVHHINQCAGRNCVLHNMSNHSMRSFPQHYRQDIGIMERVCPHGIGHLDPDELTDRLGAHGCDGCCTGNGPEPIITHPRDGFPRGKLRRISNPI